MSGKKRIQTALQTTLISYQRKSGIQPAFLGNEFGVVNVPDNDHYVYVKTIEGTILTVWNATVQPIRGTAIWIGYDDVRKPGVLQVLGTRSIFHGQVFNDIPDHHKTHEWGTGADVTNIFGEQFMVFFVFPITPFPSVRLFRGNVYTDAGWVEVSTTDVHLDVLGASVPTDGGAKFALLGIDLTDGSIAVVDGAEANSKEELTLADIPAIPDKYFPLWAIRLYDGQTELVRNYGTTDFVDLRFGGIANSAIDLSTGTSFLDLTDTPNGYSGQASKYVTVKLDETGLEFTTGTSGGGTTTFLGLTDTPDSYIGQASRFVSVKADQSGLEFTTGATDWGDIGGTIGNQADLVTLFNEKVARAGDEMTGDLIGTDFVKTRDGTITYNADGYITQIALTDGRTIDITYDADNYITIISDGTRAWTLTYNADNQIISWVVGVGG